MKQRDKEDLHATVVAFANVADLKDVPTIDLKTWQQLCWRLCSIDAQKLPTAEINAISMAANEASSIVAKRASLFAVAELALSRPGDLIPGDRGAVYAAARIVCDESAAELNARSDRRKDAD